jgi:stage II sporulation protein M
LSEPLQRRNFWYLTSLTLALFVGSVCVGFFASTGSPALGEGVVRLFRETIASGIANDPSWLICLKIFLNNLQANLLIFLGGVTLGMLTAGVLVVNGLVIGVVVEVVRRREGPLFIVASLLPHGIIEIPAFVLSGVLGFCLAQGMWGEVTAGGDAAAVAKGLGRRFILVVLPLIAIAAVVEAFITPALISLVQ